MADESQNVTDLIGVEESDISAQMAAQVTMALSTLDSKYKENIAQYAQELHACTHEIEIAKINLEQLNKEKEPHHKALLDIEKEVEHGLRMLEHFSDKWIQKATLLRELENELKHLENKKKSDRLFVYKREELKGLQQEIDDFELMLLKFELEKQHLVLKMEPIDHKISALQKKIQELESKKQYIESSYLHRLTQVIPGNQLPDIDDTIVIEE